MLVLETYLRPAIASKICNHLHSTHNGKKIMLCSGYWLQKSLSAALMHSYAQRIASLHCVINDDKRFVCRIIMACIYIVHNDFFTSASSSADVDLLTAHTNSSKPLSTLKMLKTLITNITAWVSAWVSAILGIFQDNQLHVFTRTSSLV